MQDRNGYGRASLLRVYRDLAVLPYVDAPCGEKTDDLGVELVLYLMDVGLEIGRVSCRERV